MVPQAGEVTEDRFSGIGNGLLSPHPERPVPSPGIVTEQTAALSSSAHPAFSGGRTLVTQA